MKINCWKLIFLCFFAVSILFFALPAFADTTLEVKCVDASGAPVSNAKVTVVPLKTPQKMKDKKSDAQGVAEFTKLEDGPYRVFGRKEGFAPALYDPAVLKGSPEAITLTLAAGADKKLYFEDEMESKKALALFGQGIEAYKQNKYADAEKLFSDSLEINPSLAELLYYLSVARLQQGKFDEAAQTLDKTIALANALMPLAPGSGPNPYERILQGAQDVKKKLPAIKADDALRQKNYEVAVKEFSALANANPTIPEYHASLATALFYSGRYDEALASIDKAIQLKPGTYDSVKNTIIAKKENAQIEKAQAILDEGDKLLAGGDAASALKKFEQAKALVGRDNQSLVWVRIGKAQAKSNQPEAVESFKKAIEVAAPEKIASFRNELALYYVDLKKYDDAVDVLADPKAAGSESPEMVLLTLVKNSKDKQPKLAEAALERIIKLNPGNYDAMLNLGQQYYFDKDNDRRAKELLTKYAEKGRDPAKLEEVKGMLLMINRRNKW